MSRLNKPDNGLPALTDEELLEYARRFWLGGDSNDLEVRYDEVPGEELVMGIDEELEHTPDKLFAMKVALDHIAKSGPRYYRELKKMEERLTKEV